MHKPRRSGLARPPKLTLTAGDIDFHFVRIDPGTFVMGSEHDYIDEYKWTYELPAHEVTIDYSHYIGTTEVTVEQFALFVAETGYVADAEKQGWAFTADRERGWYDIMARTGASAATFRPTPSR